jgi:hypothetical protein
MLAGLRWAFAVATTVRFEFGGIANNLEVSSYR